METKIANVRPHPRDGHVAVVIGKSLIVWGGDRHRRPFNDLYMLDLQVIMTNPKHDKEQEEEYMKKFNLAKQMMLKTTSNSSTN